jgi:hypothetical protein
MVTTHPWHLDATIRVPGHYGVPGAALDGSTTGLSADGRTLVLAQVRRNQYAPTRTTHLLVVGTRPLEVRHTIVLRGWSVVDAISPNGRWLYLIHYASSNLTHYEVLAYDLSEHRLLAKPIVDPHDRGEAMTGFPISRVIGPGGRWVYTLYYRPSGEPFVHALDTAGVRAVCVDLPRVDQANWSARLRLSAGGSALQVTLGRTTLASIDTRTFAGSPARATLSRARLASHDKRAGDGGGVPPVLLVALIAAVAALAVALWRRARRAPAEGSAVGTT